MEVSHLRIITYLFEIIVFLILMFIFRFIIAKMKSRHYKLLNPEEYFPEEEIHTLRQTYYLIMMGLLFINVLYSVVYVGADLIYFVIYDILISLYVASKLDLSSWKHRILLLLLIPYGSLEYIMFSNSLVGIIAFIHVPVFIYFIKIYYDKFREYTKTNGLGIAIVLLFTIIFVSFFITQVVEDRNPLDALVMVSNAFTSNGYAVLGSSVVGKINSIFLVWGGYILSGVGTATLTVGILKKYYDIKNKELHERIDKLEELIKNNNEK